LKTGLVRGAQNRHGLLIGLSGFSLIFSGDSLQAETYRTIMGHYPELILADKIYWTNANRKWCTERGIRISATPKGKPREMTAKEKREQRKEFAQRNHVEGKTGNAKQAFSLNQIKAKLTNTSETWIGATIFAMNVVVMLANHS